MICIISNNKNFLNELISKVIYWLYKAIAYNNAHN